jgi:CRP/FNR family transcriptional regulator, cyclic AMP receptor protein
MVLHVTTVVPARGAAGKSPHEGGSGSPWPGWVELLAEVPLFRSLPKRDLRRVARLAHLRWYADGWTVTRIGTPGDAFYTILDGRARVQTADRHTRTLESGAFFGELALLDEAPRTATVTSAGGLTVARLARADFARLLREEPAIGLGLARGLAAVVRGVETARAGESTGPGRPDLEQVGARRLGHAEAESGKDEATATAQGQLPLIAAIPLFGALNKRHLRRVLRLAALRSYGEGATVVRTGVRGDAFYVILDGCAGAETPDGHAHGLEPGDFFGELALLDDAPRSATVTARSELTTLRIGRTEFAKLLREEPTIAVGLARGLAAIVRDLQPAESSKEPAPTRKSA